MPMHKPGHWTDQRLEDLFFCAQDPIGLSMNLLHQDHDEMCSAIMIANDYHAQDLHQIATNQKHLPPEKQIELEELLRKLSPLFSGDLGCWQGPELNVELKPGSMPYHCQRHVPVPCMHQANLDIKVN